MTRTCALSVALYLSFTAFSAALAAPWTPIDKNRGDFKYISLYMALFDARMNRITYDIFHDGKPKTESDYADAVYKRGGFMEIFLDVESSAWEYLRINDRLPSKGDMVYKKYADFVLFSHADSGQLEMFKSCKDTACVGARSSYEKFRIEMYDRLKSEIKSAIRSAEQ